MWYDKIKEAGINIHVIATGAGAGIQQELWEIPGSSAYFGGATFPYSPEESSELLGFVPKSYCSLETAVDLASVAYMKAYKFGGKNPVGIGITASVASETAHRGDHRIFGCVMTNDLIVSKSKILTKGIGLYQRTLDGHAANIMAFKMLNSIFPGNEGSAHPITKTMDASQLAKERFFAHPFFMGNGLRLAEIPNNKEHYYPYGPFALMPGAFNPPHEGHFGPAENMLTEHGKSVIFEITTAPPHKASLSVQECLQRAKLLNGYNRIFTVKEPLYLDKARAFPGMPLVVGADAMLRILDPKWGVDSHITLNELNRLHTKLYVVSRVVDGKLISRNDIEESLPENQRSLFHYVSTSVCGQWDYCSTDIRNAILSAKAV